MGDGVTRRGMLGFLGVATAAAVTPLAVSSKPSDPPPSGSRLIRASEDISANVIILWDEVDDEETPIVRRAKQSDTLFPEKSGILVTACKSGEYAFAIVGGNVSEKWNREAHPRDATLRKIVEAAGIQMPKKVNNG